MAIDFNGVGSNLTPRVRGSDQSAAKGSSAKTEVAVNTSAADRVELSAQAQQLYKNADQGSFDSERVEALKMQIADGSYQVDYTKLAGKLMGIESKL
ncbi:flagellar biosynthesis anti-sigma factor FlgM [Marinospirillum insulare]|uniref:Negative regulator of flagellin synthesis n=1 Tax=Marinospirillum insulare TaxID=217169 RepID=A0ABQ6A013_9GAMM|nr:flagellar biosynthesis anti-sigma factor FlgM [Marinospirillum insulare]GLR64605.1 flagellar biosynthesis protein FlgM [Marinospirillum insulare]